MILGGKGKGMGVRNRMGGTMTRKECEQREF